MTKAEWFAKYKEKFALVKKLQSQRVPTNAISIQVNLATTVIRKYKQHDTYESYLEKERKT